MVQLIMLIVGVLPAIYMIMKAAGPLVAKFAMNFSKQSNFVNMLLSYFSRSKLARAILAGCTTVAAGTGIYYMGIGTINALLGASGNLTNMTMASGMVQTVFGPSVANVFGWFCYGTKMHVAMSVLWSCMAFLTTIFIYNGFTRMIYRNLGLSNSTAVKPYIWNA